MMRTILFALIAAAPLASTVSAADLPGVVHKPTADVYTQPKFDAPRLATLPRDTEVRISAQQGLWYQLSMSAGTPGFVRVNDVRVAYAGTGRASCASMTCAWPMPAQRRAMPTCAC